VIHSGFACLLFAAWLATSAGAGLIVWAIGGSIRAWRETQEATRGPRR
jgi:hypothetical protein